MTITDVRKLRKGLTQLYIDGEPAMQVDSEVFLLSPYKLGSRLTDEELYELVQDSDRRRAKEKALYLLEHRSYSKKELAEKLAQALPKEAACEAACRMEDIGLINDEDYARRYAKDLFLRKKLGPGRVKQELLRKGIDGELVSALLTEYGGEDGCVNENIRTVLQRKYPLWQEDEKVKRRALAALQRLGYKWDQIRTVLREWEVEIDE